MGSSQPNTIWQGIADIPWWKKWGVFIAVVTVYWLAAPWLLEVWGFSFRVLSSFYLFLAALFWGFIGSIVVTTVSVTAMLIVHHELGIDDPAPVVGPGFVLVMMALLGKLRDLNVVLGKELAKGAQTQEALAISEELHRSVVDNNQAGIFISQKNEFVFANDRMVEIAGFDGPEEIIGRSVLHVIHPDDRGEVGRQLSKREDGFQEIFHAVLRGTKKDGSVTWLEVQVAGVDYFGMAASLGNVIDVTDRVLMEQKVRESEERFRSFAENLDQMVVIQELSGGKVLYVNPACERIFQMDKGTLASNPAAFLQRIHPDDVDRISEMFRQLTNRKSIAEGVETEQRVVWPDGQVRWVQIKVFPILDDDDDDEMVTTYGLIGNDITEARESDAVLRESEARFRCLVEDVAQDYVFFTRDRAGTMTYISPEGGEGTLGRKINSAVGKNWRDMADWTPETIALAEAAGQAAFNGQTPPAFEMVRTIDGPQKEMRTYEIRGRPVLGDNGEVVEIQGVAKDITEIKKNEERIKAALKEKEVLLREVLHRVKNNMQVISGLLHLQAEQSDDPRLREAMEDSQRRIQAMALVHQTLYRAEDLGQIKLRDYLPRLADNLQMALGGMAGDVELSVDAQDVELALDKAVPCGLIINELLSNSFKHAFASGRPGKIKVSARQNSQTQEVEIVVRDNGVGFPEDADLSGGKSLGMFLVTGLVNQQLGGSLHIEQDQGARVRFSFHP